MLSDFRERDLYVVAGGHDLGLLRGRDLAGDGRGFADHGKENLQLDERRVGEFGFVDVGAVFGNGGALGSPSGEPADLSGEAEFDGVDDAALTRAIRA